MAQRDRAGVRVGAKENRDGKWCFERNGMARGVRDAKANLWKELSGRRHSMRPQITLTSALVGLLVLPPSRVAGQDAVGSKPRAIQGDPAQVDSCRGSPRGNLVMPTHGRRSASRLPKPVNTPERTRR